MQKLNVKIDGMGCGACVRKATEALKTVPGLSVENVEVGSAVVSCAAGATSEQVVEALGKIGFSAKATPATAE